MVYGIVLGALVLLGRTRGVELWTDRRCICRCPDLALIQGFQQEQEQEQEASSRRGK